MNLPNKLSLLRIFLVPVFVVAYYLPFAYARVISAGVFVLATLTDFLDGYLARKHNLVTDLGKLLDPIADKVLVTATLFCIASSASPQNVVTLCVGATLIVGRELLVSAIRQIGASKGVIISANVFGKIKTILQDVALPIIVVLQCDWIVQMLDGNWVYSVLNYAGAILFVLSVLMTIVSGVIYVVQNKKVFGGTN